MLKFPPIKNTPLKLPEEFFYKKTYKLPNGSCYNEYKIWDKQGKIIGEIQTGIETISPFSKSPFFPGFKKFQSVYIYYIESHKHNFAQKMLNFIKIESQKSGCEGRFHLYANDCYTQEGKVPPHVAYRKFGMESLYELEIKQVDDFIAEKITLEDLETPEISMYYIPKELKNINIIQPEKDKKIANKTFFQKIIEFLHKK